MTMDDSAVAPAEQDEHFGFVDVPRLELNQLLQQLVGRAGDVLAAQNRLGGLLAANRMIISALDLSTVLRHIVTAACQLVRAKYAALGVLAPDGGLQEFIHVGIDEEMAERIGPLPSGKGLLGAVIDDARPIRLRRMSDDIRSVGFPANHPPMSSFLGVPVRVRDTVFGNLYLTEAEAGEFTAEDEELVTALAATAGIAIQNARLYEEAQRRQRWLHASMQVTRQLLSSEGDDPLSLIAALTREIADADIVTVVLPTPEGDRLMVEVASGTRADDFAGLSYALENTMVGRAFETGAPVLAQDVTNESFNVHLSQLVSVGPVMVLPLLGAQRMRGALAVGRLYGRDRFDEADLDMATTFSNHAAIALELADARADQQRMVLLEDRDRIARDLHDHVIQKLFGAGLAVQGIAAASGPGKHAERLEAVVREIDDTIRQIRTSIFQLRGQLGPETGTTRTRLMAVADDVTASLGFSPNIRFDGPIDSVVPEAVVQDLCAVLREALTNIARHAHARRTDVNVQASTSRVSMQITDNGVGIGDTQRRSGLANLRLRAEQYNGTFELGVAPPGFATNTGEGTSLTWTIPLS